MRFVRRGLADLLNSVEDFDVIGEAGTVGEALRRIPAANPQVAILDGRLPDGSGIEVCRIIREDHPQVRCLILTSYDDDEAIFAAVLAGAAGYVLKQIRGSNLIEAVRQVAAGQSLLDPSVTDRVLRRIREGKQEDARLASLNTQERKILALIAEGLTNRQIGERLYLAEKTVKNNVSSLLGKLGMQNRTQAAVFGATLTESDELDGESPRSAPAERDVVTVPDLIGLAWGDARQLLAKAELVPVAPESHGPLPGPEESGRVVVDQTPTGGTRRAPGSSVTVWLDRGGAGVREPRRPTPTPRSARGERDEQSQEAVG